MGGYEICKRDIEREKVVGTKAISGGTFGFSQIEEKMIGKGRTNYGSRAV